MRDERPIRPAAVSAAWRGVRVAFVLMLAWGAMLPVHATVDSSPAEPALRATLERHLVATVTRGEQLTTILSDGKVLATRKQYRQLHVDRFREPVGAWCSGSRTCA